MSLDVAERNTIEEERNPVHQVMMVAELVEEILNHLPTEDIKSCLLVNRLWAKEAMKHVLKWSKVEFLKLDLTTQIGKHMEEMKEKCHGRVSFRQFEKEEDITAVIALGEKYRDKIEHVSFTLWWNISAVLPAFHYITSLTLRLSTKNIMSAFQGQYGNIIFIDVNAHEDLHPMPLLLPVDLVMSNLKTLTLEEVEIRGCAGYNSTSSKVFERVLKMCPNLEQLNLHGHNQRPALTQLMKNTSINRSIHKLSLIGIDDNVDFWARIPVLAREVGLRLTVLEIDLSLAYWSSPFVYARMLEQLLITHGLTLREVVLRHTHCSYSDLNAPINIPSMPKLEKMKIFYNRIIFPKKATTKTEKYIATTLGSGDGPCKFPKLNEVRIGRQEKVTKLILGAHLALLDTFFPLNPREVSYSCPTVEYAWVDEKAWTLSPKIRMKMGKLFPNAEILKFT